MRREMTLTHIILGIASLAVIVLACPILVLLGGSHRVSSELVVDPELLEDDPGVDVDE